MRGALPHDQMHLDVCISGTELVAFLVNENSYEPHLSR